MKTKRPEGKWWKLDATTTVVLAGAGSPIRLEPGSVFNDAIRPIPNGPFLSVSIAEVARDPETVMIGIVRPGELGDVLVALEACRILNKAFPHLKRGVTLYTHSRFHRICQCQDEVQIGSKPPRSKAGYLIVDFTSYFELDHLPGASHVSRLDRVLYHFGVDVG